MPGQVFTFFEALLILYKNVNIAVNAKHRQITYVSPFFCKLAGGALFPLQISLLCEEL